MSAQTTNSKFLSLTLLLMIAALLGACLRAAEVPSSPVSHAEVPANRESAQSCSDEEEHDDMEPAGIEDELLRGVLTSQAIALLDSGRTVDMATLVGQLGTGTCILDLPQPSAARVYDPVDLYPFASLSVVVVGGIYKCDRCSDWHVSAASGFILTATGAIVTNYHVVDSSRKQALVVMTADRQVYPVKRVLAASRADDLAILEIEAEQLQPLPLVGNTADALVGSSVSVISHPRGRFYYYSEGVISRYFKARSAGTTIDALTITAEYARGSSGAPVLNRRGEVVAVVSSTESIYYTQDKTSQRNLQMVFRTCIPAANILRLIQPLSEPDPAEQARHHD